MLAETRYEHIVLGNEHPLLAGSTRNEIPFAGIIYARPTRISVGRPLQELELLAAVGEPHDLVNTIVYRPL